MLPAFLIRGLTLAFGYVYPGYQCFKAVQRRRLDVKELTFWCRFWILLALLTTIEFFLDPILSWVPMYPELKLALDVFLWHPHTLGADYIYDRFLVPLLTRHEEVIDRTLKDVREQVQDAAVQLFNRGYTLAQVQFMELLAYLSALSIEAARQAARQSDQVGLSPHPQIREIDADADYTFVDRDDATQPQTSFSNVHPTSQSASLQRDSGHTEGQAAVQARESSPVLQPDEEASTVPETKPASAEITYTRLRSRRKASGAVARQ